MIEDFTYDFTYFLDAHKFYFSESSKDIITRFYIFTHQFCDKIDEFNPSNLPCVFKDFLEKDEEVFVNSYSKYDNTDNGGISETIYTGDC